MSMLLVRRAIRSPVLSQVRFFVKVGDVVPVNYLKDEKPPTIKEDKEYPDWLKSVAQKQQPLAELMAKYDASGVSALSFEELVRLKRTYSKDEIKTANLAIKAEKDM
eukprot:scaffold601_cov170-Ochromonas_danica.AAC.42